MNSVLIGALVLIIAASGCIRGGTPDVTIPDEPIIGEEDLPDGDEPGEPDTDIGLGNTTGDGNLSLEDLLAQNELDFSDQLEDAESEGPEDPGTDVGLGNEP